jgi:D-ornithine 4,5-aminomutase subunit beta
MLIDDKLDITAILQNLESYRPKRKGWRWRQPTTTPYPFPYAQISEELKHSVPLQTAVYFDNIDPQPDCVITCEIASGRFEEDLRRMRMAAWHGADHIMVIRTLGQSHYDGLVEGTPEGIGGVPITRKQLRVTRKALDFIEEEVGRLINFHSYVSGLAGPEMALMFAEEGVNGAHQDFQYNILYRNINAFRSVVDSAAAKVIMAQAHMLQIDGAHNANATAIQAWKVMPELLVQHAINCHFSQRVGMSNEVIALSTVPPTAPPLPKLHYDLPYAVAVRFLFRDFKFRAQQNTRYSGTNLQETTILHVLDTLISRLTSADIQSTIPPDEARNIPWHYPTIQGVTGAKQTLLGLDGLSDFVSINREKVRPLMRDLIIRAILMLEDMIDCGGYFEALESGFFIDSGFYPERNLDGIRRMKQGGVGQGTVFPREPTYFAPVCHTFGLNNLPDNPQKPCDLINGCTLCDDDKIQYIDELDEQDNVHVRLRNQAETETVDTVLPESEFTGDGFVTVNFVSPISGATADKAALEIAKNMNLLLPEIADKLLLHPAEGTYYEVKGIVKQPIHLADIAVEEPTPAKLDHEEIRRFVKENNLKVVGATLGNDEHSVGLREIMDIKHGGLEKFGFDCLNIGTSVSSAKLLEMGVEYGACAVLASLIVSHKEIHKLNMQKLSDLALEMGVRQKFLLISGGPQVTHDTATNCGLDAGFGFGTAGEDVANFIVNALRERSTSLDKK